jgi:hypothetical protein
LTLNDSVAESHIVKKMAKIKLKISPGKFSR